MNKTIDRTDLDGTFLNTESKLSNRTREVLIKLLDNGLLFTVSTLRSIEAIKPLFDGINLNLPVIELNGAFITNFVTKEKLVFNDILGTIKNELIGIIENSGSSPVILSHGKKDNLYFKEILNEGMAWYYDNSKLKNDPRLEKYIDIEEILDEKWMGLTVIDKLEQLEKLKCTLEDRFLNDISVNVTESLETPGYHWLTIHSIKASKSNGITYLK
jgi:HAD superfamily hydrolase (TIGR01484 family)